MIYYAMNVIQVKTKMHEDIMEAIEKAMKDFGVDWILHERGDKFTELMAEIKLALVKVLD